jgi:CDP-diacylglycerol--glycerol-3-phosphate 3-phosphatidyltransferase
LKPSGGLSKLVVMWKLVPNILTFVRLGLTGIFLAMILYWPSMVGHPWFLDIAFVLFVVASLTDVVDGYLARRWNATSKFGRMIDPLVDKVLVCGAFICFALIGAPQLFGWGPAQLAVVHWTVTGILLAREVYVTVLRQVAEAHGINFAAVRLGKIKMFVQTFAIGTVLIKVAHVPAAWGDWFMLIVFAIMVVITVASGLQATQRIRLARS